MAAAPGHAALAAACLRCDAAAAVDDAPLGEAGYEQAVEGGLCRPLPASRMRDSSELLQAICSRPLSLGARWRLAWLARVVMGPPPPVRRLLRAGRRTRRR